VVTEFELKTIRACLARLLSSECFRRAHELKRLLEYIVTSTIDGKEVKEYIVAVDGLGRCQDFDSNHSNIVRVQIRNLRSKLNKYYSSPEGQQDLVKITIPKGKYLARFEFFSTTSRSHPPRHHSWNSDPQTGISLLIRCARFRTLDP
jgi:hypothetical protein